MQIVVFELGGEKYAIETTEIQGIDKITDVTPVPLAPGHIKGLINLRGSIISVVDPYVILGIDSEHSSIENIIIIETDTEVLGIIVDKVSEVIDIDSKLLKNIDVFNEDERSYLKGTINMGEYLVTLIDIKVLLGMGA
jgi:purine-binding chemotaxis protein CheW